jgi:hypothetical protein
MMTEEPDTYQRMLQSLISKAQQVEPLFSYLIMGVKFEVLHECHPYASVYLD